MLAGMVTQATTPGFAETAPIRKVHLALRRWEERNPQIGRPWVASEVIPIRNVYN
jgi:hypothetical protein